MNTCYANWTANSVFLNDESVTTRTRYRRIFVLAARIIPWLYTPRYVRRVLNDRSRATTATSFVRTYTNQFQRAFVIDYGATKSSRRIVVVLVTRKYRRIQIQRVAARCNPFVGVKSGRVTGSKYRFKLVRATGSKLFEVPLKAGSR